MDRSYTLPTLVENRKNFSNDATYEQKIEEQWGKIHLQKMKNKMYVKNLTRVWELNQLWNILQLTYEILRDIVQKDESTGFQVMWYFSYRSLWRKRFGFYRNHYVYFGRLKKDFHQFRTFLITSIYHVSKASGFYFFVKIQRGNLKCGQKRIIFIL